MRRVLLVLIGFVAAGLAVSPAAQACSLVVSPGYEARADREALRAADVAIYGVVSSIRMLESSAPPDPFFSGRQFEARIRVTRVFKGMPGRIVRVRGDTHEGLCGIGRLRVRQRLGLLLERPGRPYSVSLQSTMTLIDLLRATGGRWRRSV